MNIRIQPRLCALVIALVAFAPAAWARWQPGLLGGWINNFNAANDDWISVTEPDANSGWVVYDGPHAATNHYNSPVSTTCPPIWAANRTWIYKGQMFLSKGTHWFCGQIDDARYLAINGTQYMKNTSWSTCAVSSPGYTVVSDAGEWVDIDDDGNVYVNGVKLDEPYISEKALGETNIKLPYQVPDGRCFVMGDHRATSIDSRNTAVGCISNDMVIGRLLLRVWPLSEFGSVH